MPSNNLPPLRLRCSHAPHNAEEMQRFYDCIYTYLASVLKADTGTAVAVDKYAQQYAHTRTVYRVSSTAARILVLLVTPVKA